MVRESHVEFGKWQKKTNVFFSFDDNNIMVVLTLQTQT